MKILFIASSDDHGGGAKSLLELVGLLYKKGIRIVVINPRANKLNQILTGQGIENYSVGYQLNVCRKDCNGLKYCLKYLIKYLRYKICQRIGIRNLKRKVSFNDIDIIHINNSVEDIGVYFSNKYNIPIVWHLREFGDLDFDFKYFHKNVGKYISDNSFKVVAISNAIKDAWVEKGVDSNKVVTITHGVNPDGIISKSCSNDNVKIVFAGKIAPPKGQFDFIKVIASLPENYKRQLSLDLYGDCSGDYRKEIDKFLKDNDLTSIVSFKGFSDNLKELLCNYDVGVVNSRCEAMGRVTIEYMMAGLCVLASNRGANNELTENGKYGITYEYGDADSIRAKLIYIVDNRTKLYDMGQTARQRALEKYSIVNNVTKFIELYNLVLSEKENSNGTN